jgi:hypothetical protein
MAGRCFRVNRFADPVDSTMIRTGRDGEGRRRLTILSATGVTGMPMFAAGIGALRAMADRLAAGAR